MRPIGLVLAFALPLAALHAQTAAPDSGDRVRIHFADAGTSRVVTGTLLYQDADSMTLLAQLSAGSMNVSSRVDRPVPLKRRVSVSRAQLTRVDVSTGRHTGVGKGARIGAGIGVVGGAVLGVANLCTVNESFLCFESPGQVVVAAVGTGVVGAALGALVGLFTHHEKWVTAVEGPRASVMLRPSELGTGVGLSIRF